eukprot:s865_g10.t1
MSAQGPHVRWGDGCFLGQRLFWLVLVATIPLAVGPRPPAPRDRSDLIKGRVTAQTASIRQTLLQEFVEWLQQQDPHLPELKEVARNSPIVVVEWLEEYGKHLYEINASRRNFAETINMVQQLFPYLRPMLAGPWQLVTTWESLHPSQLHPPLPFPLLQAMVAVAVSWRWIRAALMLLLGFFGLLRPAEACSLKVEDCIRSTETGCPGAIFLKLVETKSRTRGAWHQSVRVDEPFVIAFLDKCLATMHPKERIWPHTVSLFRTRFAQLLERACGQSKLCKVVPPPFHQQTKESATKLKSELVRWRLLWTAPSTLVEDGSAMRATRANHSPANGARRGPTRASSLSATKRAAEVYGRDLHRRPSPCRLRCRAEEEKSKVPPALAELEGELRRLAPTSELRLMEFQHGRWATLGELEEGERQMKQAEERMAKKRGELPIEDKTEVKQDEADSSEELNRGGAQSAPRDPQLEYFQDRYMHDQLEKEEIRKILQMLVEENRQLKNRLSSLEGGKRDGEEPKFSTPEDDVKSAESMKQVMSALEEAAKAKEAEDPPKGGRTPPKAKGGC